MKTLSQRILLEQNEQVIAVVRKHWFILFLKVFMPTLLLFLPFFVPLFVNNSTILTSMLASFEHAGTVGVFFGALWALLMWFLIFNGWTDYYLDMWTITNVRVIAIDQRGLFRRSVASFRYERLQDINIEINGLIATFLDFGTLEVQTAGHGESEFIFPGAPHPRETKALILEAADKRTSRSQSAPNDDGV